MKVDIVEKDVIWSKRNKFQSLLLGMDSSPSGSARHSSTLSMTGSMLWNNDRDFHFSSPFKLFWNNRRAKAASPSSWMTTFWYEVWKNPCLSKV